MFYFDFEEHFACVRHFWASTTVSDALRRSGLIRSFPPADPGARWKWLYDSRKRRLAAQIEQLTLLLVRPLAFCSVTGTAQVPLNAPDTKRDTILSLVFGSLALRSPCLKSGTASEM